MKKIYLALVAAATLFAGCSKEVETVQPDPVVPGEKTVTVKANVSPDTKVSSDNAGIFKWQSGDAITIVTNHDAIRQFSTSDSGLSAEFSGQIPGTDEVGSYALYPASTSHVADGNELVFHIDDEMVWSADASNMPMLGKITGAGTGANFQAVGGALKLVLFNIPAEADFLLFSATNKKISGDYTIADASIAAPVIVTVAKSSNDNELLIDFSANYRASKVFYIPLPTGTIDGFTVSLLDDQADELFSKTTEASLTVTANKLIIGPALNCASMANAGISNSEIVSNLTGSYANGGITNSYSGSDITWNYNACKQTDNSTSVTYMQLRKNATVSYVQLPSFSNNIASIELEDVHNGSGGAYSGTLYLRSSADNEADPIASATPSLNSGDNYTFTIPANVEVKTGYLMTSAGLRFKSLTVRFRGGAYDVPTITSNDDELTIDVGETEATTNVSLANNVDGLGISCILSGTNADKFTAALAGTTLTVTAKEVNASAADYTATLTLKATGAAAKEIAITQKTKLVPNPTVSVTPANGKFSASWTADANASSYVAYLHTATTATPATGGTDISSSISHDGSAYSITDYATANGTYYLYIKVNGVTSGYEAPTAYVEKTFTCEGTPKGSAASNPYTVAEAVAAYDANNSIGSKYVKGIVCQEGATYCFISDDGTTTNKFELYNFSGSIASSDLKVGDAVIAHGDLYYYSSGSMYEINGTTVDVHISKPSFTPDGANFVTSQSVAIASTGSSSIRYTTNGSAPTVSTGSVYSSALDLSATTTVKAVGIDANDVVCTAVASATFTKVSAYAVTWSNPDNGSITVKHGETTLTSGNTVAQGETITITVAPDDGFVLSALSYNDGSDHDIKSSKSFTMPASAVSITATFESGDPEPTAIYTANFEGDSEHRTSGNNSYTSNSYTVGGVSWNLTYADIISNNSLEGSYNCTMRSAKKTNNCPTFTTGNILSSSTTVTKITFQATFNASYHQSHSLEYSTNGGSSWNTLTDARDNEVDASNGYSATFTSVTTSDLRLRFTVTCTGHTSVNSTCDSRIDNIIVYGY